MVNTDLRFINFAALREADVFEVVRKKLWWTRRGISRASLHERACPLVASPET